MDKYHKRRPNIFLTAEEIYDMKDDEIIGVNRIAIHFRITQLQIQKSSDKEAREILHKAINEITEREKKYRPVILWGAKMTVRDVKIAFGDLSKMSRTSFKKII